MAEIAILGENRVHRILVPILFLLIVVEWAALLIDQRWLSAFLATFIIATLLSPVIFRREMELEIPTEFHIMAIVFMSFMGWWHLKRQRTFFVRNWIRTFIRKNPEIFNKG